MLIISNSFRRDYSTLQLSATERKQIVEIFVCIEPVFCADTALSKILLKIPLCLHIFLTDALLSI